MAQKKTKRTSRAPRKPRKAGSGLKLTAERVRLNRQGYDAHGRYWGTGQRLYSVSVTDRSTDIAVDTHMRADTGREAKANVLRAMMKSLSLNEEQRAAVATKHGGDPHDSYARVKPPGHQISTAGPQPDFEPRYAHEPINLEGSTDSELEHLSRNPRAHASQRELAHVFLNARKARLAGMIDSAMQYEARAQAMYDRLPASLRW